MQQLVTILVVMIDIHIHVTQTIGLIGMDFILYNYYLLYIDISLIYSHGTRCAGEIAAARNNSVCGVGVAYDSMVAGKTFESEIKFVQFNSFV